METKKHNKKECEFLSFVKNIVDAIWHKDYTYLLYLLYLFLLMVTINVNKINNPMENTIL